MPLASFKNILTRHYKTTWTSFTPLILTIFLFILLKASLIIKRRFIKYFNSSIKQAYNWILTSANLKSRL
jgi:F0F1-type ATP synthase membrane subunit a